MGDMYEGNMEYEETGEKNCDNQNRYSVVVPNNQNEHYVVNGALNSDNFETQPQDFTNYSGERIEMTSPITMMANQNHSRPPSSISLDKLPRKKQALVEVAASMAAHSGGNVVCLDTSTGQQVILNTHNHTSVIKAGEKPKNKYKEVGDGQWGEPKVVEVKGENVSWEGGLNYDEPADLTTLNLNTNLQTRRRVSFNPLIVSDPAAIVTQSSVPGGICPIPPSPGSRRRHFSFQPISPRQSLPQSPPASPFIS